MMICSSFPQCCAGVKNPYIFGLARKLCIVNQFITRNDANTIQRSTKKHFPHPPTKPYLSTPTPSKIHPPPTHEPTLTIDILFQPQQFHLNHICLAHYPLPMGLIK